MKKKTIANCMQENPQNCQKGLNLLKQTVMSQNNSKEEILIQANFYENCKFVILTVGAELT